MPALPTIAPQQLAIPVSSSATASLEEMQAAQIQRMRASHERQRLARIEAQRKANIFAGYRRPVERAFKTVWAECRRINGGHQIVKATHRGNWVVQCAHCEMPGEAIQREGRIDDYTYDLMIDDVGKGNLAELDLSFTPTYNQTKRIEELRAEAMN